MKRKLIIAAAALLSCGSLLAQPISWSEPQLLIKAEQGLMAPTWSPDGSKIAVTGDNFVGIWVVQEDGTDLHQVSQAPGAGYQMRWESNQEILSTPYSIENQKRLTRIERVNATTGKVQQVAPPTRDLKRSTVLDATNVLKIMLDEPKNATAKIAGLSDYVGNWVINPTLSPDGTKIAFQIVTKGLFVCDADGSNLVSLGKGSHASWLPDGHNLMMTLIADDGHRFIGSDIYCVNIDSGNAINITPNSDAIPVTIAVSPDGTKLAFDNDTDGAIYIINLNY
ncbi:MAG: PD40 domain-containing protein [Muribaculaceae bacterium]|nr:PD40 domain-containing protein [Muribaculaceae bacterium]